MSEEKNKLKPLKNKFIVGPCENNACAKCDGREICFFTTWRDSE
jgi:hypothetical protein